MKPRRRTKALAANAKKTSRAGARTSVPKAVRRPRLRSTQGGGEKYHFLFHAARDPMFLADARTRRIVDVNLAAVRLMGFSRERLLAMKADQLHPKAVRAATMQGFKRHAAGSTEEVESLILTSRGREVPVGIRTSLLSIDGRPYLLGTFRNMTRQKREEQKLRESETRSRILSRAAMTLLRQTDPLKRYHYLLDHAREMTGSRYGFIGYIDPVTGYLVAPTMTKEIWDECRIHDKDIVLKKFGGLWGWVLTHKETVLANDPLHDPRRSRQPHGHIRITNFLGVPCIWRGKLVGMVALANKPGGYTREDEDLIRDYSRPVTVAILDHRHLMEKQRTEKALRKSRRLQSNLLAIGRALPLCHDISEAWNASAGPIVKTIGARAAALYMPDPEGTCFKLTAGYGLSDEYMQAINDQQLPLTRKTVMGTAFLTKKPAICRDIETDPKFKLYRGLARREGYRSIIVVPIIPENTCMGTAVFYYEQPRTFHVEEINLVHLAIRQLTPALARIEYDRKIRESEERFRSLVENSLVGAYLIQDGIFCYVNPMLAWTFGYSQEELIGSKGPMDLTDPADRPLVEENLRKRVAGEVDAIHYPLRGIRKDKKVIDVEVFGSRVMHQGRPAVVGTLLDVTERNRTEQALRESEEKYRMIFQSSPLGILHFDRSGKCTDCNDIFADIIGASKKKVLGFDLTKDLKDQRMKDAAMEALSGRMGRFEGDYTSVVGGRTRILKADFGPILSQGGSILGGIGVFEDITDKKRLEEELSRAQRLEAAGRVAGQIAHDFNNLLSPLMAYPDLIRMECKDNRVLLLVEQMQSVAIQMSEINQQLLTLGRRGHYAVEVIHLDRLLNELIESFSLPMTVVLEKEVEPGLLPIKGGAAQLNRVFSNLINNAREAMNDIGTLRITMRNIYLDRPLKGYATIQKGEYVRVDLQDTGCGIEEQHMDRIFEPFFSTKTTDKKRGSGLGLSVVRSVVEDHNGYVGIKSRVGHGTVFELYFPITRDTAADEEPSEEIIPGGNERVLVIDDDPIQRTVLGRMLKQLGYDVDCVESGEAAADYVKDHPQDLLVLDMVMDGIDGVETFRRVREVCPDQKAVILSGYAESDRVAEALRMGAGPFVRKPVNMKTLSQTIRRELDK